MIFFGLNEGKVTKFFLVFDEVLLLLVLIFRNLFFLCFGRRGNLGQLVILKVSPLVCVWPLFTIH